MLAHVNEMRRFCREQKPYAGLIEIDADKRREFALGLLNKQMKAEPWRRPGVYPENDQTFPNHCFWHSVVNFCYLDPATHPEKFHVGNFSGAEAMSHCFTRRFGEEAISADAILRIAESPNSFRDFFRGDVPIPLLEERRENLLEAAFVVKKMFRGYPEEILAQSRHSAAATIGTLLRLFPIAFGRDFIVVNGEKYIFGKRANLWPMMCHGRALGSGAICTLVDPHNIPPVCDYQVPNGYRKNQIHVYSAELAEMIDHKVSLERHGREENAIRCATFETVLDMVDDINLARPINTPPVGVPEVDPPCWFEGRLAFKAGLNHMLCRNTDH